MKTLILTVSILTFSISLCGQDKPIVMKYIKSNTPTVNQALCDSLTISGNLKLGWKITKSVKTKTSTIITLQYTK